MRALRLTLLAVALAAAPASASPLIFSGTVRAELGYGTNPFLINNVNKAAGYGAISFAPVLTHTGPLSSTSLSGQYYRQEYFSTYGHSQTFGATLSHRQQVTEHLQGSLSVNYIDTDNALLSPAFNPGAVDVLTTGQRSRLLTVSGGAAWQASARDSVTVQGNYSHSTYGNRGVLLASDYDNYGGTVSYLHALNARTKIGFQVSGNEVKSQLYPNSSSIEPALSIEQILSPIWTFNGDIGLIRQHISGPFGGNSNGIGYSAKLCGKYPRRSICGQVSRQSSPSGIGGLRTNFAATISYQDQLTERSSVTLTGDYEDSKSRSPANAFTPLLNVPHQRLFQARVDYSRIITQRLSAGASARGQWREYGSLGSAHAIGGSVNLTYKIGRIS